MRFLRHGRIFQSDVGYFWPAREGESTTSRRWIPNPNRRTRREDRALHIVLVSSDRLFLDRVACQHCPSPLHRRDQINTHFQDALSKPDISTLR
jgi:hypothetical protein